MDNKHILILVIYLDKHTLYQESIVEEMRKSITSVFDSKGVNSVTFFMPTNDNDNERIECINPVIASDEQMTKIDKLISDISKNFDINNTKKDENE